MFPLYVSFDKSENIFGPFRYVYIFARLWGYIPFSVNVKHVPLPSEVKLSFVNSLVLMIQISVYVVVLVLTLTYHSRNTAHISDLIFHGLNKLNELGIFCGPFFLLADVVNRQRIWNIFQKFLYFDREVFY